jgi:hypothetical protein
MDVAEVQRALQARHDAENVDWIAVLVKVAKSRPGANPRPKATIVNGMSAELPAIFAHFDITTPAASPGQIATLGVNVGAGDVVPCTVTMDDGTRETRHVSIVSASPAASGPVWPRAVAVRASVVGEKRAPEPNGRVGVFAPFVTRAQCRGIASFRIRKPRFSSCRRSTLDLRVCRAGEAQGEKEAGCEGTEHARGLQSPSWAILGDFLGWPQIDWRGARMQALARSGQGGGPKRTSILHAPIARSSARQGWAARALCTARVSEASTLVRGAKRHDGRRVVHRRGATAARPD